jgi:hypothetical protein
LASAAEKNLLPSPSLILLRTLRREFILVALHLQSLSYSTITVIGVEVGCDGFRGYCRALSARTLHSFYHFRLRL